MPTILDRLGALPAGSRIVMPVIAQAELLGGVETTPAGKRRDSLRELYEESIAIATDVVSVDSRMAGQFATITAQLRRDGKPISTDDVGIGAIALVADLTIASSDAHMRSIRGLRVEDWTACAA